MTYVKSRRTCECLTTPPLPFYTRRLPMRQEFSGCISDKDAATRSWKEDERIIDKLLNPEFGSLNVKEITRSNIPSFLRGIVAKTRVQANRTHACLRKILNWAIKEEIVDMEGNPASGISSPLGESDPKNVH
jgi:hypothetical protein